MSRGQRGAARRERFTGSLRDVAEGRDPDGWNERAGLGCARGNVRDVRRSAAIGSRDVARSSAAAPRRRASAGAPLNAAPALGSAPPRCPFEATAPVTILTGTESFVTPRNCCLIRRCMCSHDRDWHFALRERIREAPNSRELRGRCWALRSVPQAGSPGTFPLAPPNKDPLARLGALGALGG